MELTIDEMYFEEKRNELKEIYNKYDDSYDILNESAKENVVNERFFSGSSEMLCTYDPSLIGRLRCNWYLKGSFKTKKPAKKPYHIISFDKNENVIKIIFFDSVYTDKEARFEIFTVSNDRTKLYLSFCNPDTSANTILGDVYLLKYDDQRQMTEYIHIPSKALTRDLTGELHRYKGHNLAESIKYSTWDREFERYEYQYGDDGYLNGYKLYESNSIDTDESSAVGYTKVPKKEIERFEKYGKFYFSPSDQI